jgi:hypothetical protein
MAYYVLQLVADKLPILSNVVIGIVGRPDIIESARNEPTGPDFSPGSTLKQALQGLQDGSLGAVVLRARQSPIEFALISAPNAYGGELSRWLATVDFRTDDWRQVWNNITGAGELRAAYVSLDEAIDLTDEALTVETFPWHESRLVVGAVRGPDDGWVVRENPVPSS